MTRLPFRRSVSEDNIILRRFRRTSAFSNTSAISKRVESFSSTSNTFRSNAILSSFNFTSSNIRTQFVDEWRNCESTSEFAKRFRFGLNVFLGTQTRGRGLGTMSPAETVVWDRQTERDAYLRFISKNAKHNRAVSLNYVNRSVTLRGGCQFLRALVEMWEKGTMILDSIRTRLHDIDDFDINAADVFFSVLDSFVTWYYRNSTNAAVARESVLKYQGKMKSLLRKLGARRDIFLIEAFLQNAESARFTALQIAQWEAVHGASRTGNEKSKWIHCPIADRLASFIMLRGQAVDGEELDLARRYIREREGPWCISNLDQYYRDIENIALTFLQADSEYRLRFSSRSWFRSIRIRMHMGLI